MLVDVANWRVAEAMRQVGRALLEDFALRREPPPAPPPPPVVEDDVLAPEGVVWTGRARRSPELQRFVEHLTLARAASLSDLRR